MGPFLLIRGTPFAGCHRLAIFSASTKECENCYSKRATRGKKISTEQPFFWGKIPPLGFSESEGNLQSSAGEVTRLLVELRAGNPEAEAKLIPLVYSGLTTRS